MLSPDAEEVLVRAHKADGFIAVVAVDQGEWLEIGNKAVGDHPERQKAYVLAVDELSDRRLLRQRSEYVHELNRNGRRLAENLIEMQSAADCVPDSCDIVVAGSHYEISYLGADGGQAGEVARFHDGLRVCGEEHDAHAGVFRVLCGDQESRYLVLLGTLDVPDLDPIKGAESIPRRILNLLFKRPGLKAIRSSLATEGFVAGKKTVAYPEADLMAGSHRPQSIEQYIDALDDPRPQVLQDCERDVLLMCLKDRQERKPIARTASSITGDRHKRRFYDVRAHICATLVDLAGKGLICSEDGIGYEIEVRKMADARRIVAGLSSDDLFDSPTPAQRAAYVPQSSGEYDAFLCHASEDKEAMVVPFAAAMKDKGLKAWIDEKNLRWGDNLVARIQDGLSRSRFVVVFITEAFLSKKWPDTELNTALSMEIGGKTLVLPILAGVTHDTLQSRYPIVSAKLYKEVSPYDPTREVMKSILEELVSELKNRLQDG